MSAFVKEIAAMKFNGEPSSREGVWMTSREILEGVGAFVVGRAAFPGEEVTAHTVARLLKAHRGVLINDEYRIETARIQLGRRTHGKILEVFRVRRNSDAPPKSLKNNRKVVSLKWRSPSNPVS